jgi:hypothetical protein
MSHNLVKLTEADAIRLLPDEWHDVTDRDEIAAEVSKMTDGRPVVITGALTDSATYRDGVCIDDEGAAYPTEPGKLANLADHLSELAIDDGGSPERDALIMRAAELRLIERIRADGLAAVTAATYAAAMNSREADANTNPRYEHRELARELFAAADELENLESGGDDETDTEQTRARVIADLLAGADLIEKARETLADARRLAAKHGGAK